MVDKLLGYWKLDKNENVDAFMKADKIGLVLRKVGNSITSYEELSRDGDDWTLNITSTFKSTKLTFRLGEPFQEDTLDGKKVTSKFYIEGDKLMCTHEPTKDGDLPSRYEREVLDDGRMMMTLISVPENVVGKRYFVRAEK